MRFGTYEILGQLARGGMSEVYLAIPADQVADGTKVVIKRILPDLAQEQIYRSLFEEEARISKLMHHSNVVRALESGEVEGHPYLVMEYVEGVDCWKLANRCLSQGKELSIEVAVFIACEVLRALAHVHLATDELGMIMRLVHGDVSPTNIFISKSGEVKLGDFGIARARYQELDELKKLAQGKVDYLAPEQILGEKVDHRSDLFSAATVLAELIIHKHLFRRSSQLTTLLAIRDVHLDILESHTPQLPPGLDAVLKRALSRNPEARYPTASSMGRALGPFMAPRSEKELRNEIAELVAIAMTSEPVLKKIEPEDVPRATVEECPDQPASKPLPFRPTPINEEREYVFRNPKGQTADPVGYAEAVERVVSGGYGSLYEVSVDGGAFERLEQVRELARHAPALTPTTAKISNIGPPDRRGLIEAEPIWLIFFHLATSQESGLVIFQRDEVRKEVYFVAGNPRSVASNAASDLLGKYLLDRGAITQDQLDRALKAMPSFTGQLGETLTSMGFIEPVTLFRHISEQVRTRLLDLFSWDRGEFHLYRDIEPREATFPLDLKTTHLLWPGIRRSIDDHKAQAWFDERYRWRVKRSATCPIELHEFRLPDETELSLSLIRGLVPMSQVVQAISRNTTEHEAILALILLTDTGLLEMEPQMG